MTPLPAGQASVDYIAVLAVVAVVLAGAGVATGTDLARPLATHLRHALCVVGGAVCSDGEARRAGLEPCVVRRREDGETLAVKVAVVRLGTRQALLVEDRSDGSGTVSFVDEVRAGGDLGVAVGLRSAGGGVDLSAGYGFGTGRSWRFRTAAQRDRFITRFAGEETLGGELTGVADAALDRVGLSVRDDRRRPAPDVVYEELQGWAELGAGSSLAGIGGTAGADGVQALGRRRDGPVTTYYGRISGALAARLGVVVGTAAGRSAGEVAVEIDRVRGAWTRLRIRGSASWTSGATGRGGGVDAQALAERAGLLAPDGRPASGKGGLLAETTAGLDLRSPGRVDLVRGLLLSPDVARRGMAAAALAEALREQGDVDVAVHRLHDDPGVPWRAELVKVGGTYRRAVRTRELAAAWTRRAAGPFRAREDCAAA